MRLTERKQIKTQKRDRQVSLKEAPGEQLSAITHNSKKVEFERSKKSG